MPASPSPARPVLWVAALGYAPGSAACRAATAASLGIRNVLGVGAIMKPMKSMASSVATSDVHLLSGRRDLENGTSARNSESGVHT